MSIDFKTLEKEIVYKNRILLNLKNNTHINRGNICLVEKELDSLLYRYYKLYRNNVTGMAEHEKYKI